MAPSNRPLHRQMNERDATTRWQKALACLAVAACVLFPGPGIAATAAPAANERQKIDALIHAVEVRKDLNFERLGTVHSSKEAAQMLRTKLHVAGSRVKTVDDFIDHVASATASGSTYYVLYPDGRRTPSAEFLRSELKRINTSSRSTTP